MIQFLTILFAPVSVNTLHVVLAGMRIGIGLLTMIHGYPKIVGGVAMWRELGTFVNPLGIYFLPIMWGFLGACTEFFGGILLILGTGTRIASLALIIMMFVAVSWHLSRGDSYNIYSFPLSLMIVYTSFLIIGGDIFSLDYYYSTMLKQ